MKTRLRSRILCMLLAIMMVASLMPAQVFADDTASDSTGGTVSYWTPIAWDEVTADHVIAITMSKGNDIWMLPAAATGGSTAPAATIGTINAQGELETKGEATAYGWKISSESGGFRFTITSGSQHLYTTAANNGVRVGTGENGYVWNLTQSGDYLTAVDSKGNTRYLGVFDNQDWRTYTNTNNNIAGQTVQFWAFSETIQGVETPTANPASGEVAANTLVTFSTTTAEATMMISLDGGLNWSEQNSYTVIDAVTIMVKAVKGNLQSETATFDYTVKAASHASAAFDKLTQAPADGSEVVLVFTKDSLALSTQVNDKKLDGVAAQIAQDKLTVADEMAVLKVGVADGVYTFENNGLYLTSAPTGNGVSFASDANSDLAKWTLEAQDDGTWYIKNVKAVYNETKPQYLEYYKGFTTYSLNNGGSAYKFDFYGKSKAKTGFVTDLADLTDGAKVVIVNKANQKALSQTYSGNYNSGVDVTVSAESVLSGYSADEIWTLGVDTSGQQPVYTFSTADGKKLSMDTSYSSMPLDKANDTWTVTAAPNTDDCFYIDNIGRPGYRVEWYSGKTYWSAYNKNTTGDLFLQQFYLTDGVQGGVQPPQPPQPVGPLQAGDQIVIYNAVAEGVLGIDSSGQNASLDCIAATIENDVALPQNGAYVFTVGREGDYYTFKAGSKYLSTCDTEQLFMADALTDSGESCGYWSLEQRGEGYLLKSKTARYKNNSVCVEFFSGSFSGWTFKASDAAIFTFRFYPLESSVAVIDSVANVPSVVFDCQDSRFVEQDFPVRVTLDDLAETISNITISYSFANTTNVLTANEYDVDAKGKVYTFTVPASALDSHGVIDSFTVTVDVVNSRQLSYRGTKLVSVTDEPFIGALTPLANAQTLDDKRPVISAEVGNIATDTVCTMTINGTEYPVSCENGKVSMQFADPMEDGRYSVTLRVTRKDGKSVEKSWSFYVGKAQYQLYFGQLHSHTGEYSDGSGTLAAALEYIEGLPASANVQFVAFTDHSNFFDDKDGANPEGALYDMVLASDYSKNKWESYNRTIENFNASHGNILAIPGFEMTWSGGPGHINTFNTPGIVSRNNTVLNNKTSDAGMKAYYALLSQSEGVDSISQLNHPGKTFGNFSDFNFWDAVTDSRIYLIEVGNGEGQIGAGGYYPSYEQYTMALDKGWHVAPTNNQDNHKGKWGNANDARDVIYTDTFTVEGLYDAIRQYRVYATEDKNLEIQYTVNGEPLGTAFATVPDKLNVAVSVYDPDSSDSIAKVELIANSGTVAYVWDDALTLSQGLLEAELDPTYTYYYVRVTQADNDLAVTAPVWVGESLKLGISAAESSAVIPVTGEPLTITTTLFNSEASAAAIKSVTYTANGSIVLGSDTAAGEVPAGGTKEVTFSYTPDKARRMDITVNVVLELEGVPYTFAKDITLEVQNADELVYIGIDASHYNEYVAGNYKDSMGNFTQLAAGFGVRVVELKSSQELIDACKNEKYQTLIFTAPSRRLAAAQSDPRTYSAEELAAIAAFHEAGGMVIVSGWGDQYENYAAITGNDNIVHMAAAQNALLEALGSSMRLGDDEVVDAQLNGGQEQRLYFSTYNFDSYLLDGVEYDADHPNDKLYTELYSNYGGCSVYFTDASEIPSTVTPVVYGHASTNIANKDSDSNPQGVKYQYAENDPRVIVMATEELTGKGPIIVSGAAFMSNFEVQATVEDTAAEKNYSNYKICENLVQGFNKLTVTPIQEIQAQTEDGLIYVIEGTVTSNASGYDRSTAFFDCIYVQDETAGICCFPVAGNFKVGDTVRIKGYTDFYQGEMELQVASIEKTGEVSPIEPVDVTAQEINDLSKLGSLVRITGTVESFEYENGLIQTIMVKDASGKIARVFIDGYITTDGEVQGVELGANVTAVGLSSYDNTWKDANFFPRIRVRDRADIVCTPALQGLIGDANGDGKVNAADRVILSRHLAKWPGYTAEQILNFESLDINKDNKVNALDRIILSRYLAKWGGEYDTYFK